MDKKLRATFFYITFIVINLFAITLSYHTKADSNSYTGPGDDKKDYDSKNYQTNSLSLDYRKGKKADLIQYVTVKQLGLPKLVIPNENPITKEKIDLGKKLFFDRRLSLNNTMSCGMCHVPEQGFTSNEIKTAVGIEGRSNLRNTPTLLNVAFNKFLFHDAREYSLEGQVWQPVLAHSEMAMPSFGFTLKKIKLIPGYVELFEKAFPEEGVTMETFGKAIASYERSLISGNSSFDKWYYGKDENAVSKEVKDGFKVFSEKGNCIACHSIGKNEALFFDNKLHNTGVGYAESMGLSDKKKTKVQIAPGEYVEVNNEIIKSVNQQKKSNDLGLYSITENPNHRWLFKTPTLRNISLTSPYMHNGSISTLEEVIDFYDNGGIDNELLSPMIKKLNLTNVEKNNLKIFLESLVGDNIEILIADALSTPVGNLTQDDPNWANNTDMGYNK